MVRRSWLGGKKTEQRNTNRRTKRNESRIFKAVCPLEIGDTVAIKTTKDGETKKHLFAAGLHSDYNGSSCTA